MKLGTPEMDYFCIDLEKLYRVPDLDILLRLLAVFNDLSMAPYLAELVRADMVERPELSRYQHAMYWYLLRHRMSGAAESILNTIGAIKKKESGNPESPIWKLLRAPKNSEILSKFRELEEYLPTGKNFAEYKNCKDFRNRIGAHYGHQEEILFVEFEHYIERMKKSQDDLVDWHMDGGEKGKFSRNLLMDSVMASAWYRLWNVSPTDCKQLKAINDKIVAILSKLLNFINLVLLAYVNEYDLVDTSKKPDWNIPDQTKLC